VTNYENNNSKSQDLFKEMDKKIFDLIKMIYHTEDDDEVPDTKKADSEDESDENDEKRKQSLINNLMSKMGGAMVHTFKDKKLINA